MLKNAIFQIFLLAIHLLIFILGVRKSKREQTLHLFCNEINTLWPEIGSHNFTVLSCNYGWIRKTYYRLFVTYNFQSQLEKYIQKPTVTLQGFFLENHIL